MTLTLPQAPPFYPGRSEFSHYSWIAALSAAPTTPKLTGGDETLGLRLIRPALPALFSPGPGLIEAS